MLIDPRMLHVRYSVRANGVLHVGGHHGEERPLYDALKYSPVWWVDGDKRSFPVLQAAIADAPNHHAIRAVVADEVRKMTFNLANNEQSSSILDLGTHKEEHPDVVYEGSRVVTSTTIDILRAEGKIGDANYLNLDIQGAELMALKGATQYLDSVDYIYSEVNNAELYEGGCLVWELDEFLGDLGFNRVETTFTVHGWGDAFYVRSKGEA